MTDSFSLLFENSINGTDKSESILSPMAVCRVEHENEKGLRITTKLPVVHPKYDTTQHIELLHILSQKCAHDDIKLQCHEHENVIQSILDVAQSTRMNFVWLRTDLER